MAQSGLIFYTYDASIARWQYATSKLKLQSNLCSQCRTANGSSGRLAGRWLAARQAQEKEKTQAQQQLKQ
jgi:hypothetical protein